MISEKHKVEILNFGPMMSFLSFPLTFERLNGKQ